MAEYKYGKYHKCSFCGVINIYLNLITYEDDIFIMGIIQTYVLHW